MKLASKTNLDINLTMRWDRIDIAACIVSQNSFGIIDQSETELNGVRQNDLNRSNVGQSGSNSLKF